MLFQPIIYFEFEDDSEVLITDKVKSFVMSNTIRSMYQSAILVIDDYEGHFINYLKGRLLSKIVVKIAEVEENITGERYKKDFVFRISKIEVPFSTGDGSVTPKYSQLGGNVVVHLLSDFFFNSTFTNKAYKGKLSEIIKELIKESGIIKSGKILDSSDKPNIKYRINESESHFIMNKIAPYYTIGGNPSYIFVNELGELNARSFIDMYNQEPEYSILPQIGESDPSNPDKFVSSKIKIKYNKNPIQIVASSIIIGKDFEDGFSELKKVNHIYNMENNSVEEIIQNFESPISGDDFKLPIDKAMVNNLRNTSYRTLHYSRSPDEQKAVHINLSKNLDNLFTISVIVPMIIDSALVGKTVEVMFIDPNDDTAIHWLSGKYVVDGSEHGYEASFPKGYFSRLVLIAPSGKVPKRLNPSQLL